MLTAFSRQFVDFCVSILDHLSDMVSEHPDVARRSHRPWARLTALVGCLVMTSLSLSAATAPAITTQPASKAVTPGAKATFTVVASGTAPLSYQWSKNGTAISGATAATYTTPATVSTDNAASFTVKVTNSAGTKTSNAATLSVNLPPTISTQPANKSVVVGSTASFSVVASGTGTLTYQWSRNGSAITGATAATYTTAATVAGDNNATFTVKVTNSYGTATSSAATLTVTAAVAPSITTQPANKTVTLGSTATFSVVAAGTAPLTYQWSKNGSAISGATSASYTTLATVTADNGASFTVKVTNSAGSVTSNAATLTLNLPPTITGFTPVTGGVGTSVTVTGTNFTGVSAVKFNGVAASSYSVVSATSIAAAAPTGVTTGNPPAPR